MGIISIDGSYMEGGGQIMRTASAMSILTQKPIRIFNIRANRPQPGLRTQHLRGLEAIAGLCNGRLEGAKLGSRQVFFYPEKISEQELKVPIETAGSVGLVLQSLLVASLHVRERTVFGIEGGATFGKYAPPLQYIQFVLLPLLRRMGYHAEINIIRHGFYPVGGAKVKVMIDPMEAGLRPLSMPEQGKIETVDCISVASTRLRKPRVAERQARVVVEALGKKGYSCNVKTRYADSACPGSGLLLVASTDTGCIIGADGLGERGKPAEEVAEEAITSLLGTIESGATVDSHMSDQLLPYMALANGKSSVTAPELTAHAQTNMWAVRQFLPHAGFDVENLGERVRIECMPG